MTDILWHPVLPWPWLLMLGAGIAAGIAWSLARGIRSGKRVMLLAAVRLAALALMLILLFLPQQRRDDVTVLRPQLAVLVDTSESMTDPADPRQPKRADRVREWFRSKALAQARRDFDVRLFTFDRTLNEQGPDVDKMKFAGPATNLFQAVNQVQEHFRGQPLAGVLLLSDGLDTTGAPPTTPVSGLTQVFTFELEEPFTPRQQPRRIALASLDYPPRVVAGWDTEIRVTLAGTAMSGRTVPVELWRDGRKQAETTVAFNEQKQTREAVFTVTHELPGTVQYELRVNDPAADKESRSSPFVIEVMEPGNRVLYVQNTLGFDFKFLRKAILSDRNLQLSAFVRMADGRLASLDESGASSARGADFSPQALANCAVLILGDLAPDALPPPTCTAIKGFVDHGGGLVLLGGPNLFASDALASTPLAPLLPIRLPAPYHEGSFPVQITETGLHHPVFGPLFAQVQDFPPLLSCNAPAGVAPNAEILIQAQTGTGATPLAVSMRYGAGRVVVLLTDTMWRWRLAAKGWSSGRSPHDTFWTQLMDWLIPKEQQKQETGSIQLFTERLNYALGERPEVRAILHAQNPDAKPPATLPLEVRSPDKKVFNYTLNPAQFQTPGGKQVRGYRAEVDPNVAGVFQASTTAKIDGASVEGETRFVVSQPATEITGKPVDRDILKQIAAATGGKFCTIDHWDAWRGDLHFKEQHFSRVQLEDLWNHPLLLGLILVLLCAEWITRKLWNLP